MFIAMSLDSLGTAAGSIPAHTAATSEQNTAIAKIQADMYAKMLPAHDAEKNLLMTLAEGVAVGNIDRTRVDASIANLSATAAGVNDAVAASLNQLHAILTPPQRAALVDKVEAHFAVWNDVNSAEGSADPDARGGRIGRLTTELGLSSNQVDTIRGNIKSSAAGALFDRAEGDEHLRAFGEAFASNAFDAKMLSTAAAANAHIATWGATRMARFYEAVTPVLTHDQDSRLADSLRRHANYKRTQTGT